MQTAFQADAFQTVQLAFQINLTPPPTGGSGDRDANLGGIPALGQPEHPMLGGGLI